jgi:predicted helicase
MSILSLKPNHKAVQNYYRDIGDLTQMHLFSEGNVAPAFAKLLGHCARQFGLTLVEQHTLRRAGRTIRCDGVLLDSFKLVHGIWEAKETVDDLPTEIKKKFEQGYPKDNIIFQAPDRAIIWQDGRQIFDADITNPARLIEALKLFLEYRPPAFAQWYEAVAEFKSVVPQLASGLLDEIRTQRQRNPKFIAAFNGFMALCQQAINPNISSAAIEEMLIQHLLTERIFRKVFDNPDFARHNVIAREIEKVIDALTGQSFSRADFHRKLDRFYGAIEETAATIDDFAEKQGLLNTVYEKFFQGFSVRVADTHGIVYTPQPIVEFMVRSVGDILRAEFDRSWGDPDVHILDPFVGTGNFILRIMREIPRSQLPAKYADDLHCNEVMLLPYYIAALNIEHEYYSLTGHYEPFAGICLVDTFDLAEDRQMLLFTVENTQRVKRQKEASIFVIIGNPPYNAGQVNENDNNKNRKYPVVDRRVAETYSKDSNATLRAQLSDPYVKAIRWATDRIGDEGMVAFVTNNSFIDAIAFDGMRKHLEQDFDALYILDLGGNVRKNPKLSGTTHNVFGIQVGVSINILVKKKKGDGTPARIYYARVVADWRKEQKYDFLNDKRDWHGVEWQELTPDENHTWLTAGLEDDFELLLPLGSKEAKAADRGEAEAIFKVYSSGVKTNRDAWVYNFRRDLVADNVRRMIDTYNEHIFRWHRLTQKPNLDDFVTYDDRKIKWDGTLKADLVKHKFADFFEAQLRVSLYRPFTRQYLYFDRILNNSVYRFPHIFPTPVTKAENRVICVSGVGSNKPFHTLVTSVIPCLDMLEKTQCFPYYTYDTDGSNRRENITDWALAQFREAYDDDSLTKWDIFHYVYGLLHHPQYREKYAANLRRELPRLPFASAFWPLVEAGRRLAELHVNYEQQPEYPLQWMENPDAPLDWRVERMKLSPDKTQIRYNDFLTLAGVPEEAFAYRLGNRSALEWVLDQYQVRTDGRSGITNDPNRPDDERYIVRLLGQIITVSVETVKVVAALPEFSLPQP